MNSVLIHADARLYAGLFDGKQTATLDIRPDRKAYVHLIRGELEVNGYGLQSGDALLIEQDSQIRIENGIQAEVLVFDLAA